MATGLLEEWDAITNAQPQLARNDVKRPMADSAAVEYPFAAVKAAHRQRWLSGPDAESHAARTAHPDRVPVIVGPAPDLADLSMRPDAQHRILATSTQTVQEFTDALRQELVASLPVIPRLLLGNPQATSLPALSALRMLVDPVARKAHAGKAVDRSSTMFEVWDRHKDPVDGFLYLCYTVNQQQAKLWPNPDADRYTDTQAVVARAFMAETETKKTRQQQVNTMCWMLGVGGAATVVSVGGVGAAFAVVAAAPVTSMAGLLAADVGSKMIVAGANGVFAAPPPQHWVPDSERSACGQCQAEFGMLRRRHHCRGCGEIFCHVCASSPSIGERMCTPCKKVAAQPLQLAREVDYAVESVGQAVKGAVEGAVAGVAKATRERVWT
eukprot:SAG31_NODE_5185_length_2693_cov_8.272938_1_plen_383_part_00